MFDWVLKIVFVGFTRGLVEIIGPHNFKGIFRVMLSKNLKPAQKPQIHSATTRKHRDGFESGTVVPRGFVIHVGRHREKWCNRPIFAIAFRNMQEPFLHGQPIQCQLGVERPFPVLGNVHDNST